MLDPFCEHARGAKVTDGSSVNSFTFSSYQLHTMSSNTEGNALLEYMPNIRQHRNLATLDAAGAVNATGGTSSINNYTELLAQAAQYRIVSWGVHIVCTSNALNSQGLLRIETVNRAAAIGDTITTFCPDAQIYPLKSGEEIHWVSKPIGNADANEFLRVDNQIIGEEYDWTGIRIWATGAQVSTMLVTLEVIYHLELTPIVGSLLATTATPAAANNPVALGAARTAAAAIPSSLASSKGTINRFLREHARQALLKGAQYGMTALGSALGSPMMGRLAGAAFGSITGPQQGRLTNVIEVD